MILFIDSVILLLGKKQELNQVKFVFPKNKNAVKILKKPILHQTLNN